MISSSRSLLAAYAELWDPLLSGNQIGDPSDCGDYLSLSGSCPLPHVITLSCLSVPRGSSPPCMYLLLVCVYYGESPFPPPVYFLWSHTFPRPPWELGVYFRTIFSGGLDFLIGCLSNLDATWLSTLWQWLVTTEMKPFWSSPLPFLYLLIDEFFRTLK